MNEHDRIILDDNKKIKDAFEKDKENDRITEKSIKKLCFLANTIYLSVHLVYIIFFFSTGYHLMGYINVASFIYYILLFILFKINRYDIYVLFCGFEIIANMTASSILFGFDAGFHLILIGLCAIAFFTGYFSLKAKMVIRPIHWAIFLLADCILLFLWDKYDFTAPYYENIPVYINTILFITHLTVTFSIVSMFLYYFVTYIVKLEKKVLRDSKTDRLTQIGNRKALEDYVSSLDLENERYALTILDIDNFKNVNDQFGHLCGDHILRELADICLLKKQPDDFVIRFGGEEFIFVSPVDISYDKTCEIMENFRKLVEEHIFSYDGKDLHITVTMGIEEYEGKISIDEWVRLADAKLYKGKANGKNQLVR